MRCATVDIGTNTVLLLVAERASDGSVRAVAERATITRLGAGVDRTRRLSDVAVARTVECLREYAETIRELGVDRLAVVGTSAMRDAKGGDNLRAQVRSLFGVDVRVLTGAEEAQLTFRGALGGLAVGELEDVPVFDIGGGSTEVVIGRITEGRSLVVFDASYDVGSVRLTERHVVHDPPTPEERHAITSFAREAFASVPALRASAAPIGVAGTMTTLAAVSLGLATYDGAKVHGRTISVTVLRSVVERLAALTLDARCVVPGMEPKRADVIVAGGLVALALMDHWGARSVRVSDRGVRWGLADELLETASS